MSFYIYFLSYYIIRITEKYMGNPQGIAEIVIPLLSVLCKGLDISFTQWKYIFVIDSEPMETVPHPMKAYTV